MLLVDAPVEVLQTGVYCIRNLVNGKRYVGSAAKSFQNRWKSHRNSLRRGDHIARHLQAAWNKYGESSFKFEVLERCTPENCIKKEQYWIDSCQAADSEHGYNQSPTAGSILGMKLSAQAKSKITNAVKKQWEDESHRKNVSAKVSATLTGRKLSAESLAKRTAKQRPQLIARNKSKEMRDRMSKTLTGHSVSEETKRKIAASLRGRRLTEKHRLEIAKAHQRSDSKERSRAGAKKQWDSYTPEQRIAAVQKMQEGNKKLRGTARYNSVLTEKIVQEARELRRSGWTYKSLQERYDCGFLTIYKAVIGKTWSHVQ